MMLCVCVCVCVSVCVCVLCGGGRVIGGFYHILNQIIMHGWIVFFLTGFLDSNPPLLIQLKPKEMLTHKLLQEVSVQTFSLFLSDRQLYLLG